MDFTEILSLALRAVSERVILLVALAMVFGLFAWAMNTLSVLSLSTAASFAVLVFLPILYRSSKSGSKEISGE